MKIIAYDFDGTIYDGDSSFDFYKFCLDCAYERGFKWVLCFLAREADAEMSYRQIQRYWNSLHDLTGTDFCVIV